MAEVVTGMAFGMLRGVRQHWLAALQGLDLAFLIHIQHQGMLRRTDIEADDIPHLFHKRRVCRQLKLLGAVGLQTKGVPDAVDAFVGNAVPGGHATSAPMGGVLGFDFERQADYFGHLFITDGAGSAAAAKVENSAQPGFVKAFA
jgi:hypothetical protein